MHPCTWIKLLTVLAVVLLHIFLAIAFMLQRLTEPRWVLCYFNTVSMYGALYFRKWLCLRRRLTVDTRIYHGLGYAAVMLGAFLSALFFFSVNTGMALSLTVGVWFSLAIAFYFLYLIITLHLEEEFRQVGVEWRPPV